MLKTTLSQRGDGTGQTEYLFRGTRALNPFGGMLETAGILCDVAMEVKKGEEAGA